MIRYSAFVIYVDYVYSHRIQFIFWKFHANIDGGDYEFLNSNGQQYPQQTITYRLKAFNIKKNTTTYDLQAWDRHKDVARLNQLMESQTLDNWISMYIYKQMIKNLERFTPNQKDHILSQKWRTIKTWTVQIAWSIHVSS